MKIFAKILQWCFSTTFCLGFFANILHWTSILFAVSALLMMPLQPIRDFLKKIKIKSFVAVILSIIFFCIGCANAPVSKENISTESNYSIADKELESTICKEEITNDVSSKENISSEETSSNIESSISSEALSSEKTEAESTPESETDSHNDQSTDINTSESKADKPAPPNEATVVGTGIAEPVNPANIPKFSDSPFAVINNNIPNFSVKELELKAYENYSSLDSLGRCGLATAVCGTEIMPKENENRGNISNIKPTGWVQAKYNGISGGYLFNRCHLISWQLSAENANPKNLITGTRYMNTEGMLPFENMVADYIKETNNHVAYRITPIFEGSNLLCSGVQMEAYSIEDDGEGIKFNVYCYNVQPNITIDYATGKSNGPSTETNSTPSAESEISQPAPVPTPVPTPEPTPEPEPIPDTPSNNQSQMVWIPNSGSKYHSRSGCSNMKNPSHVTIEEAIGLGYSPCKKCY